MVHFLYICGQLNYKNKMRNLLLISIALFTLNSCVINSCEEPVLGCMDPEAINYNNQADYDNNSCDYSSDIVFYLDPNAAFLLGNNGVQSIKFYVNGSMIGSQYNDGGFISQLDPPNCFDQYFTTATLFWSIATNSTFEWEAVDETGFVWFNSSQQTFPNECLAIQLTAKNIQEFQENN